MIFLKRIEETSNFSLKYVKEVYVLSVCAYSLCIRGTCRQLDPAGQLG